MPRSPLGALEVGSQSDDGVRRLAYQLTALRWLDEPLRKEWVALESERHAGSYPDSQRAASVYGTVAWRVRLLAVEAAEAEGELLRAAADCLRLAIRAYRAGNVEVAVEAARLAVSSRVAAAEKRRALGFFESFASRAYTRARQAQAAHERRRRLRDLSGAAARRLDDCVANTRCFALPPAPSPPSLRARRSVCRVHGPPGGDDDEHHCARGGLRRRWC